MFGAQMDGLEHDDVITGNDVILTTFLDVFRRFDCILV